MSQLLPLKRVARVRFSPVDKKTTEGEVPVRLCNYTDVYYKDSITRDLAFMEATATPNQLREFSLHRGDVLITKDSESPDDIGIPAYVSFSDEQILCGYHLAQIRPDPQRLYARFLYWWMASDTMREELSSRANGITRFGLKLESIAAALVRLPPVEEQRAIADFLDRETARIDALIERKRHLVAKLTQRVQAVIDHQLVSGLLADSVRWPTRPLRKLAGVGGLFTDGDWIESPYIVAEGIRLIQTGNIGVGEYREQGYRFITQETFRELRCTEILPKDVLICRLAYPVGRACLAPDLTSRMVTSVDVCILRPDLGVDPAFLVLYLSSAAHLQLCESIARGSTRSRISRDQLGQIQVPVPPLHQQREMAAYLNESLRTLKQVMKMIDEQIFLLSEHRQAFIIAAVTGQMEVSSGA